MTAVLLLGSLAVVNAMPQLNSLLKARGEAIGATPVDYPVCALLVPGGEKNDPDDQVVRIPFFLLRSLACD